VPGVAGRFPAFGIFPHGRITRCTCLQNSFIKQQPEEQSQIGTEYVNTAIETNYLPQRGFDKGAQVIHASGTHVSLFV